MDEKLIQDFLDTYENENSRKTRYYDLKRVEDLLFLRQEDFLEDLIQKDISLASFKSSLIAYALFLKYTKQPHDKLLDFYQDEKNFYTPKKIPITNEYQLEEFQAQLDTIENNNERLVLSLYLLYPSLRSDILFVKYKNYNDDEPFYENGAIYFPILKKVKRSKPVVLNLDEETNDLVKNNIKENETDYIIKITTDRNNSKRVSEFLQRISLKNFKQRLSINDFRKLHVDKMERNIQELPKKEQGRKRYELSKQMGHSLISQQLSYNVNDKKKNV